MEFPRANPATEFLEGKRQDLGAEGKYLPVLEVSREALLDILVRR
jgi:hypothetical protein